MYFLDVKFFEIPNHQIKFVFFFQRKTASEFYYENLPIGINLRKSKVRCITWSMCVFEASNILRQQESITAFGLTSFDIRNLDYKLKTITAVGEFSLNGTNNREENDQPFHCCD